MNDLTEEKLRKKRAYSRKYYAENKAKALAYSKKYYQEHKEKACEYQKKYRATHKGKHNEYQKEYFRKHPEKRKQYNINRQVNSSTIYAEHQEEKREYMRKYYHNNKDKYKKYRQNALKKAEETGMLVKQKEYQKTYRDLHKTEISSYQEKYRKETVEMKIIAGNMCPAYWFLLSVRKNNLDQYIEFFKKGQNIAKTAQKHCVAVQNNNNDLCPFCNLNLEDDSCAIPHVMDLADAENQLLKFAKKLKVH